MNVYMIYIYVIILMQSTNLRLISQNWKPFGIYARYFGAEQAVFLRVLRFKAFCGQYSIPLAEWKIFSVADVTFCRDLRLISGNGPKPWTRQDMTREESMIFYETHARRLYNTAIRIVSDSPLAEEIMQDTILKYIMSDPGLSGAQASVWLTRTCVRKSIDALRRKKRERLFLEEYPRQDEAEEGGNDTECTGKSDVEYVTADYDLKGFTGIEVSGVVEVQVSRRTAILSKWMCLRKSWII